MTKLSNLKGLSFYVFFLIMISPCFLAKNIPNFKINTGLNSEVEGGPQEGIREKRMNDAGISKTEESDEGKSKRALEESSRDKRMNNAGLNLILQDPPSGEGGSNETQSIGKESEGEKSVEEKPHNPDTILFNGEDCSEPEFGKCVTGSECQESFCVCSNKDNYGKECMQFGGSFFARVVLPETVTGVSDDKFIEMQQKAHTTLEPFEKLMTLNLGDDCDADVNAMSEAVVMYFGFREESNGIELDQFKQELATATKVVALGKPLCDFRKFLKCGEAEAKGNVESKCTHLIPGVVETSVGKYKTVYKLRVGERCFHYPGIFDSKIHVQCVDNAEGPCSRETPGVCTCKDGYTGQNCETGGDLAEVER